MSIIGLSPARGYNDQPDKAGKSVDETNVVIEKENDIDVKFNL